MRWFLGIWLGLALIAATLMAIMKRMPGHRRPVNPRQIAP